ncbi:MAG: Trm112 family protein [Candidatus Nanohaloarchaeota archaeon]|nr:Trm112 family protein [Candidatus Nanohaloarchaeota archaeon]
MSVSPDLLEILACPKCKGEVKEKGMFLVCERCELAYPVLNGEIPDMLMEDAWELSKAEKADFKHDLKL